MPRMTGRVLVATMADRDDHDTGAWHPERAARLPAVDAGLAVPELAERITKLEPRQATTDEMARAHDRSHLDRIEAIAAKGGGAIDADTQTSAGSWETARWASGAGLAAIEALDADAGDLAFVSVRPPGHHATRDQAMGFCLVNNIAVAASTLANRGERVAVIDWDVHHGNGTQDIFWNDDRVFFASTHEHPAYPGSGRATEMGGPAARGLTLNVPLPSGSGGDAAVIAFDQLIGPEIETFQPSWILISAGFDAHQADPLANLRWTAGDYAALATRVASLVPPRRTIAFLEGGYDLEALQHSVTASIGALAGLDLSSEPASNGYDNASIVGRAIEARRRAIDS
jgi:acetoin utilization deacetylase AcuC-like enzyme